MTIRPIIRHPDARLRKVSEPCAEVDAGVLTLASDLIHTAASHKAAGLAAVQIGDLRRVVVILRHDIYSVFINPEIVQQAGVITRAKEGCLSIPWANIMVPRPGGVRVKALTVKGETHEVSLLGQASRAMQHEIDHLNGKLILDYRERA